jgi:SNF2 family DNA or RNA helicase
MQPAIRFSREQCVDLPPVMFETRHVEMSPEQKKLYKDMLNKLHAEYDGGQVTAVNEAVKASKLVQIACGVAYTKDNDEMVIPAHNRIEVVKEIIEEAGAKVIVFVPFTGALSHIADELGEHFDVATLSGATPKRERDEIFRAFQHDNNPRVLVAQPAAMSHGLTLTAANTIVWFAPVNSNEIYSQANGRINRPGQKKKALIVNVEGSEVERKMYDRLKGKQKMQGLLLDLFKGV